VKLEQHTCLSRVSRIVGTVHYGLKACISETPTAQYIIYNIRPTQKKTSTTYPKNVLPSRLPHHQCVDPGADFLNSPHLRMNCADLAEDSGPGRIRDHVLAPSRTRISSPPVITKEQRPSVPHTKHNPSCARAMGQDYPITRPSPGDNPTIYPSFPVLA
jgi:hypothetical protein